MGDSKTSTRHQANIEERRDLAYQLYLGGATYREIGERLGLTVSGTQSLVRRALELRRDEQLKNREAMRTILVDRSERLFRAHYSKALKSDDGAISVKHGEFCLKLLDRLAKLTGADAPTQTEITVRTRTEVDDEIAKLAARLTEVAGSAPTPHE